MKSTNFAQLANAMTKSWILTTLAFDTLLPRVNFQTWIAKLKHKLSETPQQLRRKALPTEMTLQQLLDQGRAYELSHQQAQEMENNNTESVNQRKLPRHEITSRRISIHNAKDKDKNQRNYVIIAANPILILAYVQQKGKRVDFVGS